MPYPLHCQRCCKRVKVTVYDICFTWRLVTYVRCRSLRRSKPWRRRCGGALLSNWETVSNMKSGWLLLIDTDSDLTRLAGPAQDRLIGGPAARQPACQSQRLGYWPEPGVKLTWKYASSVVPSQTGGLVHAQAIKSDSTPLQNRIKPFVWAGSSFFKPLEHLKR
jgi:hypothetical protein